MRWISLCSVFVPVLLIGQAINLTGTVAIQNSAYETGTRQYIRDASVRAPMAKPVVSDRSGRFTLEFSGVSTGTPVRLTVSKPGFEVVNARDVQSVILGRIPAVEVLMADAQKLAEAQLKYYRIATDGITKGYQRKMAALSQENVALAERLSKFSSEHEREVKSLMDAINVLTTERDKALGNASELAERFATADLDNASDRFRRAFELFREGELDSALVLLDKERLDVEYASAKGAKEKANQRIREVYKSLELKVNVLRSAMDPSAALLVLDDMAAMLKTDPDAFGLNDEQELAWLRGHVLVSLSRYKDAIAVFARGSQLVRQRLGDRDLAQVPFMERQASCEQVMDGHARAMELLKEIQGLIQGRSEEVPLFTADFEFALSRAFEHDRQLDSAMAHAERSLELRKAHLPPTHDKVLRSMQAIALILRFQGRYDKALELQLEMLELAGPDGENYGSGYGTLLHNVGQEYKSMGNIPEAERFLRASLVRELKDLGPQHPQVLANFTSMAALLDELGREQEAIALLDSALIMNQGTVPEDHNIIGYYHTTRAAALSDLGDQQAAMSSAQRAVEIRRKAHGEKHPYVMATYEIIATIQARSGDLEGALSTTEKIFDIILETFGPDDINTHFVGLSKAGYLVDLGRDTLALSTYSRHLAPAARTFGEQEPTVVGARIKQAIAQYRTGTKDGARVALERAVAILPDQQAEWYLSKIALDEDRQNDALDHLLKSARLCDVERDAEQRKVVLHTLRDLATRLGKEDLIDEFKEE